MTATVDLKQQTVTSTVWYLASRVWTQSLSWLVTILVARWLAPADYGLFAMALAAIAFLEMFQELGMGTAIVQRRHLTQQQLNAVFWFVSLSSVVLAGLAVAGAPVLARFYAEPRLVWMIRIQSLTFLLNSVATVPDSLLVKDIDFRRRSLAEAVAVLASAVVVVTLAAAGFNVWALPLGHLTRAAVRNGVIVYVSGWRPGFAASSVALREILGFGVRVAGARIVTTSSTVANTAIIGRVLGGADLGFYSMATALANGPHRLLGAVINQVSLPIFSKLQDDCERLTAYFLKITKYLAVVSLPAQIGMALIADDLVVALLHEKWRPMAGLFRLFCLGNVLYVLPLTVTPLLYACGRASLVLRFSWISGAVLAAAFGVGTQFGLTGMGIVWLCTFIPLRAYLLSLGLAELRISVRTYVRTLTSPVIATTVMAAVVRIVHVAAADGDLRHLAITILAGGVSYMFVLFVIDRGFGAEMKTIVQSLLAPSRA